MATHFRKGYYYYDTSSKLDVRLQIINIIENEEEKKGTYLLGIYEYFVCHSSFLGYIFFLLLWDKILL